MRTQRPPWTAVAAAFVLTALVLTAGSLSQASAMEKTNDETVAVKLTPFGGAKSAAGGEATFALRGDALHYKLHVEKTEDATMAHVHMVGDDGTPSAVLAWLFPSTSPGPGLKEGTFTGTLVEGDIKAGNLSGPMKGRTVKELYEQIEYGKAGVAVHTKKDPKVALWGSRKGQDMMEKKHDKM